MPLTNPSMYLPGLPANLGGSGVSGSPWMVKDQPSATWMNLDHSERGPDRAFWMRNLYTPGFLNLPRQISANPFAAKGDSFSAGNPQAIMPNQPGWFPSSGGYSTEAYRVYALPSNSESNRVSKNTTTEEDGAKPEGKASKWVSAFKITSAILVTGAMNAFLFGVPLHTAAGLSLLVASFQSFLALKIHREDNQWSQALVQKTRHLMGREGDVSASGKEWAMVPIWGGVCALSGLFEALTNHWVLKRRIHKAKAEGQTYEPPTLKSRHRSLKKAHEQAKNPIDRWVLGVQERNVGRMMDCKKYVEERLAGMEAQGNSSLKQRLGQWGKGLIQKVGNASGGRNIALGYFWAVFTAATGGMVQTAMAAKLQEKIDGYGKHPHS